MGLRGWTAPLADLGSFDAKDAGLDTIDRASYARSLILCVIGNPFRPVAFDCRWRTADVIDLARGI
jgi:hypothetical protein